VYSDLGFMLLGRLVEQVSGMPLDRFLTDRVYGPMGLADLFFIPLAKRTPPRHAFAATELCPLRCRLLIGEVHDDNAWYAGGVDGHAGLFGTAEAVFRLLRRLVAEDAGRIAEPVFSGRMLTEMLRGSPPHHFSLGFDRPSTEKSSAGRYFSKASVGHLGFTGVSFWLDPAADVTVILLTNRVHPYRWHNRLADFRPRIHDRIMEHFGIKLD
jgi:CubicO group peptidase (beta-lactamase class C family)